MSLLKPNWSQDKPTWQDAQAMSSAVRLESFHPNSVAIARVLDRLRATHSNGGAFLSALRVGPDDVFDWFASRNRLLEYDILPQLLHRDELRGALPDLKIPNQFTGPNTNPANVCGTAASGGFTFDNPFFLEGQLGQRLFAGGAYPIDVKISGQAAMQLAAEYCEALFARRYEDVSLFTSYEAWTPWFCCIAWDWTSVLFDRANRTLSILAVTDTD